MNAPNRQLEAFAIERVLPGKDVLVDAVDQGAVEIEQKHRLDTHARPLIAQAFGGRLARRRPDHTGIARAQEPENSSLRSARRPRPLGRGRHRIAAPFECVGEPRLQPQPGQ